MEPLFKKLLILSILIAVVIFSFQTCDANQNNTQARKDEIVPQGKLPTGIYPIHYKLKLRIDPEQEEFYGVVSIGVDITKQQQVIWLHGKGINVRSAELLHNDGSSTSLKYQERDQSGVVSLEAEKPIPVQKATIEIAFQTSFGHKLNGLFKVVDRGENYVFSHFEATHARQVFPLFDEPRFKVPYTVTLEVKEAHKAFSNTEIIREEIIDHGFKRLVFATTKPLPSYLLAFAVGDLDVVKHNDIPRNEIRQHKIPLQGIATKGKGAKLAYALEHTAELLTILEQYFDSPYPYSKLDIVAVPDFEIGAMENAGLIMYQEPLLLLGNNPSIRQQRAYATAHAHELSHQWFGNLVTMPWWDDTWLKESFATWMAAKAVNHWKSEFETDRDIAHHGHWVMSSDIYAHSRRVREPVTDSEGIANAFDRISYSKGAAILQMLESAMTPENFKQGIQNYIKQYAWANASTEDLIGVLVATAGNDSVAAIFHSFVNQVGVPLVSVEWSCNNGFLRIDLEQKHYLPFGSSLNSVQLWTLPICLSLINSDHERTSGKQICHTLKQSRSHIESISDSCPTSIMPNAEGRGYYRWTLTQEKWSYLLQDLASLSSAEKYALANNLTAEFNAGRINTDFYLGAIRPIIVQPEWDVRTEPIRQLQFISDYIFDTTQKAQLAELLYLQYSPILDEFGLEPSTSSDTDNPVTTRLLRDRLLKLLALKLRHPKLLGHLSSLGQQLVEYPSKGKFNKEVIDPQLRRIAMASAVISEGKTYFDHLLSLMNLSNNSTFRLDAIWALAQTTEPQLGKQLLNEKQLLNFHINEIIRVIAIRMSHVENKHVTYAWFKHHYTLLSNIMPESFLAKSPMIVGGFCDMSAYRDIDQFFKPKLIEVNGMHLNLSQALEKISLCAALVEQHKNKNQLFPIKKVLK